MGDVTNALNLKGYEVIYRNNECIIYPSVSYKKALVKFQQENNLPFGKLDLKTLKALGIKQIYNTKFKKCLYKL